MNAKAVAFLATEKPETSRRFYVDVVGLRFVEEHDFAIVLDAYGTTLHLQKVPHVTAAPYTAFGLEVDDIERAVDGLAIRGVTGKRYPHFQQDARGIWTAPGGARVFWFEDPDGHVISLSRGPG